MPTIQEVRARYPERTAGRTDWDIANDFAQANSVDPRTAAEALGVAVPTVSQGAIDNLQRGLGIAASGTGSALRDIAPDLGAWAEKLGRGVIERNPSRFNTTADIAESPFSAFAEKAVEGVGQFLPAAASLAIPGMGPVGAAALMGGSSLLQNVGETRSKMREKGQDSTDDILRAWGYGVPQAAIDIALGPEAAITKAFMRTAGKGMTEAAARELAEQGLLKTIGKEGGKAALWETPTEAVQALLGRMATRDPLTGAEATEDYLMNAFGGFAGGGAIGATVGPMTRSNASGFVDQIDSARATLAAPLQALDQLPAKQSAADFLQSVTANDFGSARALEFANAQAEASVQDRDVLLEGIAQKADAEKQVELQKAQQDAAQTAATERQKQIDDFIKSLESDVEAAAKAEEQGRKDALAAEGTARTERDSGFVQPAMIQPPPPMPTDLLGDPLAFPIERPAAPAAPNLNDFITQGLDIGQRFQQATAAGDQTTAGLLERLAQSVVYDRMAQGLGEATPGQMPMLGPKGGVAPGQAAAKPARASPKVQVLAAQAAGQINAEQALDLINDIDQGAKAAVVVSRLEAARGATRSASPPAAASTPAENPDAGRGVDAASAGTGGVADAGGAASAGRVPSRKGATAPVVPAAAKTVVQPPKENQDGPVQESPVPAEEADKRQAPIQGQNAVPVPAEEGKVDAAQTTQTVAQPQEQQEAPAATELTPDEQDWYNKNRADHYSLVGKYPAEAHVKSRDQWLEDAVEVAKQAIKEGRPGVTKLIGDVDGVDFDAAPEVILQQLEAKQNSHNPVVSPREQQTRVERLNAKMERAKRIAITLRNDSEAAQWLAAMEKAKKADRETEFNEAFQNLLDVEERAPDQENADPAAGIPKSFFAKVTNMGYDAGMGKTSGTAAKAMADIKKGIANYEAFLKCLGG